MRARGEPRAKSFREIGLSMRWRSNAHQWKSLIWLMPPLRAQDSRFKFVLSGQHHPIQIQTAKKGTMRLILLIILILLLIGALPTWPYSTGWGYYPSGGLGLLLLIVLLIILLR